MRSWARHEPSAAITGCLPGAITTPAGGPGSSIAFGATRMPRTWELIIGLASAATFFGSIAAIPWLLRRLPADYFVRPPPKHPLPVKIVRNLLGFTLITAGITLLVLPGQGILTILIGLSIVDLPAKHRAVCWILQRPRVLNAVQRARAKTGRPPLVVPSSTR